MTIGSIPRVLIFSIATGSVPPTVRVVKSRRRRFFGSHRACRYSLRRPEEPGQRRVPGLTLPLFNRRTRILLLPTHLSLGHSCYAGRQIQQDLLPCTAPLQAQKQPAPLHRIGPRSTFLVLMRHQLCRCPDNQGSNENHATFRHSSSWRRRQRGQVRSNRG
jgi:hypothetical protein